MIPLSPLSLLPDSALSSVGVLVIFVALVFFSFVMLLAGRYKRCPSNRVMVIYGKVGGGNTAKCIHGGAAFILPMIQDYAYLSLEPMQIEIPLKGALSVENIRVNVPSVFTVAIGTDPEVMQTAAIRLLGLMTNQIIHQAQDIIFGQLRQVIASMQIEDINKDREKFLMQILHSLEPELKKIGLVLINVNITDITDESGYIEAIGRKAASLAIQQARGDVADNEKMGEIRVAEADREKAIKVANATKMKQIGTREAQRDQAVKLAELDKEQKIGEQTAGFQRDAQVKDAEQTMRIALAEANAKAVVGEQNAGFQRDVQVKDAERTMRVALAEANAKAVVGEQSANFQREAQVKDAERTMRVALAEANAKAVAGENAAQAEIVASQAALQVKQSEAYELGETSKRSAEAKVQEAQNLAMAKAAIAQAARVEAERRAALEAPAKAEKAKTIVEAEAESEKRRIQAMGEASAIYLRLEAEAKGNYEILAKKADGLKQIVNACGGSQEAYQLLMLEHIDTLAETAAKAISNIKFDKVVVWENGAHNGAGGNNTSNFLQSMARTLPPMMQVMKDIGGVEMPDYLAKLSPETPKAAEKEVKSGEEAKT